MTARGLALLLSAMVLAGCTQSGHPAATSATPTSAVTTQTGTATAANVSEIQRLERKVDLELTTANTGDPGTTTYPADANCLIVQAAATLAIPRATATFAWDQPALGLDKPRLVAHAWEATSHSHVESGSGTSIVLRIGNLTGIPKGGSLDFAIEAPPQQAVVHQLVHLDLQLEYVSDQPPFLSTISCGYV